MSWLVSIDSSFSYFYDYSYHRKKISKQYSRSCSNKFYYYIALILYIFLKWTALKNIVSSVPAPSRRLQLKFISLVNISYNYHISQRYSQSSNNLALRICEKHFTFECLRTFPLKLTFVTETFLAFDNTCTKESNVQETAAKIEIKQYGYVPSHSQPVKNSQIICIRRSHVPSYSSIAFSHRTRCDDRSWYVPSSVEFIHTVYRFYDQSRWWQMKEILRYIA